MIDRRSRRGWTHAQLDGDWARIVRIGRAEILEMRDPNDGVGGDPAAKCRHQYVVAGGQLWRRRLPPEDVGDEWRDQPGPVRWEPMEPRRPALRSIIDDYTEAATDLRVAIVRRQQSHDASSDIGYHVAGVWISADECVDIAILAGPITDSWWDVPLPPCPDCGGDLVWWEAGYVPGTRKCVGQPVDHEDDGRPIYDADHGCGSLYSVESSGDSPG